MSKRVFSRRLLCKAGLVTGLVTPSSLLAQPPDRLRPQPGDVLVYDGSEQDAQQIMADNLELNAQPVAALPRDPVSGVIRNRSRLNRIMVMKVDPDALSSQTKENSASGIIAYSAICTHTGCDITNWNAEQLNMACPCHESQFDVLNGGSVVGGPAPRPLAMLPLVIDQGRVIVAAEFSGRVGFQQQF